MSVDDGTVAHRLGGPQMIALMCANLGRRWGRTALTGLGVAFGVTTTVALLALTGGLSRSAGDLAKLGRADFGVFQSGLADLTASSLPQSIVPRLERIPGIASAAPILVVAHAIPADSSILVYGARLGSFLSQRLVLVSGHAAHGTEAMVGVAAAAALHLRAGQRVVVDGHALKVAGIYRSGISLEDGGVVVSLPVLQRISRRPAEISIVAVLIQPGYREADVKRAVQRALPGTLALSDPGEVARVDTNSRLVSKAAIIIAVLALLLGAVVVINTMAMAMIERRTEFGTLAAVGWSRGRIAQLILGETVAISLIGAAVGLGIGALASVLLVHALTASVFVSPALTPWVFGRGMIVGFALGILGALFSLWQILRVPTLRALER